MLEILPLENGSRPDWSSRFLTGINTHSSHAPVRLRVFVYSYAYHTQILGQQQIVRIFVKKLHSEIYWISDHPTRFWMGLWLNKCPRDVLWQHSIPSRISGVLAQPGPLTVLPEVTMYEISSSTISSFVSCHFKNWMEDRTMTSARFHPPERACSNGTQSETLSGHTPSHTHVCLKRDQNAQNQMYPRM